MASISRNDPCPCGSGLKYKKCCLKTGGVKKKRKNMVALIVTAAVLVLAGAFWLDAHKNLAELIALLGLMGVGAFMAFSDPPPPSEGGRPDVINFGM